MSGYTGEALTDRGVHEEGAGFIQKPFTSEELALRVRALLDSPIA
jgi:DNA-binding response OmpR family regulator